MSDYGVPTEEALARLVVKSDYDDGQGPRACVHTFVQAGGDGPLLGAHWGLDEVRDAIERYGVQEAGPEASDMGHPLVITRFEETRGPVFLEARP